MILVLTSLFIVVLASLAINSLENGVIENKLALHFMQKSIAFQAAESELYMQQVAVHGEHLMQPAFRANVSYQQKILSVDLCYKKRYQINIAAHYEDATAKLFIIYDFLEHTDKLLCKNEVGFKRVYWKVVS